MPADRDESLASLAEDMRSLAADLRDAATQGGLERLQKRASGQSESVVQELDPGCVKDFLLFYSPHRGDR